MLIRSALGAAALVSFLALFTSNAAAQATSSDCPPEQQPCMVLVPQPAETTVTAQVYVQPAPAPVAVAPATMPPPEPVVRYRMRLGMVIPGAIMLGAGWLVNVLVGSLVGFLGELGGGSDATRDYFGWSLVPVIGPWAQIGYFNFDAESGLLTYHVILGLVQTVGFALALIGTIAQEEIVEPGYVELGEGGPQLSVLPYASDRGAGLTAALRF